MVAIAASSIEVGGISSELELPDVDDGAACLLILMAGFPGDEVQIAFDARNRYPVTPASGGGGGVVRKLDVIDAVFVCVRLAGARNGLHLHTISPELEGRAVPVGGKRVILDPYMHLDAIAHPGGEVTAPFNKIDGLGGDNEGGGRTEEHAADSDREEAARRPHCL
ncbi:hypothetical protein BS47DRAFT_1339850 [Hydnum rufescens UP504]|uniref:Uncharacterized protein n=1 Tax=Hydnum rufescens UP504 TaxID=1448309 RepID=A0A9P6B492_9AGAM|nr:hypothetical protein BS47DRAFT_1339850 [Hydnum rufescens UP504]